MKKFSKKGVLLFAAVMAVCAFAMPAMSSAASWGVVGTEHTLHSPNIGFSTTNPVLGVITSSCSNSTFTVDVSSAAALTVTTAQFRGCTAAGVGIGHCTVTSAPTSLPWSAPGTTTSNVQISGVRIDVTFETLPGGAAGSCKNVHNQSITLTGTLNAGVWNASQHEVVYTNASGLVSHGGTGNNQPVFVTGTIRDTAQTLTLT